MTSSNSGSLSFVWKRSFRAIIVREIFIAKRVNSGVATVVTDPSTRNVVGVVTGITRLG